MDTPKLRTHVGFVSRTSAFTGLPLFSGLAIFFHQLSNTELSIRFYFFLAILCFIGGYVIAEIMWWMYFRNFELRR